jgi:proprotein convertase subtilisin/kexin type 5
MFPCYSDDTCQTCATNHILNNNNCYHCILAHCTLCSADNTCQTCAQNYILNNNTCYSCTISQCSLCSADDTCHTCNVGYTLDNNFCIPCGPDRCTACNSCYSGGTSCSGCLPLGKLYLYQHQCYSTCPVRTFF